MLLFINEQMASAVVSVPLAVTKAFSPGHVTGFFETSKDERNPLYRGSMGAGFSIDRGITTTVSIYEAETGSEIRINGQTVKPQKAEVSQWVIDYYLSKADRPYFVRVDHEADMPIGFGLGSSGAAALSLSYALNEATGSKLSITEAAQIAHKADIACKTGLGTVIAEYAGGFEMRTGIGAPGIGTVERMALADHRAVILCLAPISTKSFLAKRKDEINDLGGRMLRKLAESKRVEDFLAMSHQFAETLGLTDGRCRPAIEALRLSGFDCSVALFGETVFTIVPKEKEKVALKALEGFGGTLFSCNIDGRGARLL